MVNETELTVPAERFERLCERLPGTLYQCRLSADGQLSFLLISAGARHQFGLSPESAIADAQEVIKRIQAEDLVGLRRSLYRSTRRLNEWRYEFRYHHPNGQLRWVDTQASPQYEPDGSTLWHGFCHDITHVKQAQLALAESERRYRRIVEHISDLIMLLDGEGNCRFASPSVGNVLGYAPEALHWRALSELLPTDDAPRVERKLRDAYRQGRKLQFELRVRHRRGHYIWLEMCCSPYINPLNGRYEWMLVASRDITDRKMHELKLHELSTTDSLTGALNRGAFLACLNSELETADSIASQLSLVTFDIDHFKNINDTWGHAAGDQVLAGLGDICRNTLRAHDIFGRIGGEEFAVVLSRQTLRETTALAERLRLAFEDARMEFQGQWLSFTASFGIAERCDGESSEALMHRADMSLYIAKRQGRNRIHQAVCPDT